ncbi:hypothetical protein Sa4125_10400 [Aureimonas sp. SA4125]|nr:hypothetical protein Sa4125_10400 [Aureimonas sp. SA4125]
MVALLTGCSVLRAESAMAQATDARPTLRGPDLRPSGGDDAPSDLRLRQVPTEAPLADGGGDQQYEPFSRGSEDRADRPDDDETLPGDEDPATTAPRRPRFNLFDPAEQASGPLNRAAAPAAANAADNTRAGSTTAGRTDRTAPLRDADGRPLDPLLAARAGGLPAADLAQAATAVRSSRGDTILGRQNLAITPLRGTIPIAEDDPFAPVGIRAGTFVLYSTLDQGIGASTNLSLSPGGESGVFSETTASARLLSDWSENEAELNALASYRRNFAGELESEPRLSLDGRYRLDIDKLTTATLRGAIEYRQEDPIDLDAGDSISERPDILTYSAGADLERQFGRITAGIDTSVIRQTKTQAEGITAPDESYTTVTAALRTGYEISPALKPFVESGLGYRIFDEDRTADGRERNSAIPSLRAGLAFDLGEKFLGEVATGYAWNVPDDEAVPTDGSPTFDARLAWSPQRGTDVVLTAATSFDPDTDSTGNSTLYESSLALRHRLTHRADLTSTLSAAYRDSEIDSEVETSYAAEAGFTYWMNRTLAFTGLVRHEELDSRQPGGDYTAQSVRIGLRLQR